MFARAEMHLGDKVIRPGQPRDSAKRAALLRLDQAVIDHYLAGGPRWQSRMNAALRKAAGL